MKTTMEIIFQKDSGFSLKTKTGVLTINLQGRIEVDGIVISGPGEYEVKGFAVTGFKGGAYLIEAEEILLGYLTEKEAVDVLLTNSWEAAKNIQPGVVIPVDGPASDALVKASGLEARREKKLNLNKLGLPEETELIILGP